MVTRKTAPQSWKVTVSAKQHWPKTGVEVQTGQIVSITYLNGTWGMWGGPEGVKRQADGTGFEDEYRDKAPFPDAPLGALIGRVGSGPLFFVGNHLTFIAGEDGPLALQVNDGWLDDSTGELTVQITLQK